MAFVELDIADDIATLTLNRPDSFNAIDDRLARELRDVTRAVAVDDAIRAVVITGAGRAFCGGGDLRRIREVGNDVGIDNVFHEIAGTFHDSIQAIRTMSKAVIASINGPAAGGGFSLALACDYRVGAADTFMQLAYTSHGLSIDGGGTYTLPRLVGLARATQIALMDERIPMPRAQELELVHEVVPREELATRTEGLASRFSDMPVEVIGRTKRLFNVSAQNSLSEQLELERLELSRAGAHPEGVEGMNSFLEKRAPDYRK